MEMSQAAKPSFEDGFSAIFRIFTSPSTVYPQIRDGLSVWPGLIVMFVILIAISLAMGPVMEEAINASIIEQGQDPDSIGFMGPVMIASQILGQLIMILIIAFFYWLALTISFGGIGFGRVLTLTIYTGFIGILYQIINAVYLVMTKPEISDPSKMQEVILDLSLGSLFSEPSFLQRILSQFGLFQIWGLILMIAGAAVLTGKSQKQAAAPILVIFLIGVLLAAFLGGLGGNIQVGG